MFSGRLTQLILRTIDFVGTQASSAKSKPAHLRTGRRGEEDAYFHLRRLGYVMVARNFRSSRGRGEIDLIGWQNDILCFIEVKTRSSRMVKPAETAVDREKWRHLSRVAREYLQLLSEDCQWRFDVISVYYDRQSSPPEFELFQNAFSSS